MIMIYKGILKEIDGKTFILDSKGEKLLENELIWDGYLSHWKDQKVCARFLPQHDYETGSPIVLVYPDIPRQALPYFELYYNERLIMYAESFFGHNAINVNNEVFNFAKSLNENEKMSLEEYYYRPALGEFAPAPGKSRMDLQNSEKPYYDKFGRSFMRTIHVIRVEGLDTSPLSEFYHNKIHHILTAPVNPKNPDKYAGFNLINESCTTIIRNGLRQAGFPHIRGVFPRDMFISAAVNLLREQKKGRLKVDFYIKPQLKVKEAPYSAPTPPLNPLNWPHMRMGRVTGGCKQTGRL